MALVTATRLAQLPSLATVDATLLGVLADAATAVFENLCNRADCGFEEDSVTGEVYDGEGDDVLFLKRTPISVVSKVYVRESDDTWTTLDNAADDLFYIHSDTGEIRFALAPSTLAAWSYFPAGFRNIKADYTGGYAVADVPADMQQAVCEIAAVCYASSSGGQIQSEHLGDYGATFAKATEQGLPPLTAAVVAKYRRLAL